MKGPGQAQAATIKFRYLFHGTSSVYSAGIKVSGLLPRSGVIYLTTHPMVALIEAERTVRGEGTCRRGTRGA